jgi:hypothetical protein
MGSYKRPYMSEYAALWYYDFDIYHYDPCVANKIVNDKQFTVTWHVDDLRLSHVEEKEVTNTIDWFKSIYGEDTRVSRGKKHDYLGTDLGFTVPGEVITGVNLGR